ncbi:MAG: CBS domain-containing protein [Candidatus Bathyarchaeota archaeon]|jgi:CBS domain-containing protein|nr:CBS domain-containing protein [Candidatus Bathyarchaeota archaeon]
MSISIKDIMTFPVITMRSNAKVSEAASAMCAHNIGSLVVVDRNEKPIGIITERDMIRKVVVTSKNPKSVDVTQIMSSPLVTGDPNMDLEDSAKLMINKEIKRLPIIDQGKIVGIVTFTDLIRAQPQIVSTLERSIGIDRMPRRFKKLMRKTYR